MSDDTGTHTAPPGLPGIALCGIGDEAGAALDTQVAALTGLGWRWIELRSVDGTPLAELSEPAFQRLAATLAAAGLRTACVDSRIANWARPISSDLGEDLRELSALAPRCAALGTRFVRVMSYPNAGLEEADWGKRAIARLRVLASAAEDTGLLLLHENCAGWAGSDAARMLELLAAVDSPALRLLFDTGNGVAYGYEPYDMLRSVAPYVEHVHIKDATGNPDSPRYTLPGAGRCRVVDCLRLLLDRGWTGIWSIEPHIRVRPHEGRELTGADGLQPYLAYGRALERLISDHLAPSPAHREEAPWKR